MEKKYKFLSELIDETTEYCVSRGKKMDRISLQNYIIMSLDKKINSRFLNIKEKKDIVRYIYNSINGLGIIQPLIDDENINEIMINNYNEIFIEKNGDIIESSLKFKSKEKLLHMIQMIVSQVNRTVNESNPIVDARLSNGSRVNVVLPPIALKGPTVTIRKFTKDVMTLERLIEYGSITEEVSEYLKFFVKGKYNLFISGGTSSGKTSMLNALSNHIPKNERIITIEDSAELKIESVKNVVSLETRNPNVQGEGEILMKDLIRTSLRMRSDRIIVGEVRGEEVIEMLQAMNTGHDGSISTGHGNSIKDMLTRLETMVLSGIEMPLMAVRQQIASAIDIIIHLKKISNNKRVVLEISEICGIENNKYKINPLFKYKNIKDKLGGDKNILVKVGNKLQNSKGNEFKKGEENF